MAGYKASVIGVLAQDNDSGKISGSLGIGGGIGLFLGAGIGGDIGLNITELMELIFGVSRGCKCDHE